MKENQDLRLILIVPSVILTDSQGSPHFFDSLTRLAAWSQGSPHDQGVAGLCLAVFFCIGMLIRSKELNINCNNVIFTMRIYCLCTLSTYLRTEQYHEVIFTMRARFHLFRSAKVHMEAFPVPWSQNLRPPVCLRTAKKIIILQRRSTTFTDLNQ